MKEKGMLLRYSTCGLVFFKPDGYPTTFTIMNYRNKSTVETRTSRLLSAIKRNVRISGISTVE